MNLRLVKILVVLLIINLKLSAQQVNEINPELLNKPWTAKWISYPNVLNSTYGIYLFRKEFTIHTIPDKFIIHVSADNRYKLYINGKYVCNGPARSYLFNWNFESINIASYLHAGKNVISSMVWNFSEYRPIAQISGQTGLIIQGNSADERIINTDTTWIVYDDVAYKPLPVNINQYYAIGAGENFDSDSHPWNWLGNDIDALGWKHAKETEIGKPVGCQAGWGIPSLHLLHQREIPFMEERLQYFYKIRRSDLANIPDGFIKGETPITVPANAKVKILIDQNVLTTAYPVISFTKGKTSKIKLTYAESLFDHKGNKGNRNDTENKEIAGNSDIVTCDGGNNRIYQTLWWRTFRYIELEIETKNDPLVIKDFHSIFTAYPFEEKASFKCDNPLLTDIWNVGWRTQRLCGNETFFDCPYYEQLQYIGDTRIQALVSTYVSGDSRLARNAISALRGSQLPMGITQSRYPSSEIQIVPTFSLIWTTMVYDYWMLNGDSAFVKSMIPGIMETLNWFKTRIDTSGMLGPVEGWNFVDWVNSSGWEDGSPLAIYNGNSSIVTLQYVYALEKSIDIFEAFKMKDIANEYRNIAVNLKKAVYQKCYDSGKEIIADSPDKTTFSQHANSLAIITNTFPETSNKAKILNTILTDKEIAKCSLYFSFYLFEAFDKAGQGDLFTFTLNPWQQMLNTGLTTFAETPDPTRSDCHAWSASPVYYFLSLVSGIKPAEPGFKSVRIEPHLGNLQFIEATLPLKSGIIKVKLQKQTGNRLSGEIVLPDKLTGVFLWNGERKYLNGGVNLIK